MNPSGKYRFRRHDNIGANDAADDSFLQTCFQDTGDLAVLADCKNPKRIVLGRTGIGKTALLMELERRSSNVIRINPENLSLNYIANSAVLHELSSLGINIEPFFKLLWRHVFTISIIQRVFQDSKANDKQGFIQRLRLLFESSDSAKTRKRKRENNSKAIKYLEKWGDRFFEDVEVRTRAVTEKFEEAVSKQLGGEIGARLKAHIVGVEADGNLDLKGSRSLKKSHTVENREKVVSKAQKAINTIQVQELSGILELVDQILDDPMKPIYVVIDKLDEEWADERIRMDLLKSLLDTIKEFGKVENAKIIACFRVDLVEQIFRAFRTETGFQEDKYRSLYLPLKWNDEQLVSLLNKRVSYLMKDAYTSYLPSLNDVIPEQLNLYKRVKTNTVNYILSRTWNRPRDAIEFLNTCIKKAEGSTQIGKQHIVEAEGEYSRTIFRSIAQEWNFHYPSLPDCATRFLKQRNSSFRLSEITDDLIENWATAVICDEIEVGDSFKKLATDYSNRVVDADSVKASIISVFYKTGLVGLKTDSFSSVNWSSSDSISLSKAEIGPETRVEIHPGIWRVLGVRPKKKR